MSTSVASRERAHSPETTGQVDLVLADNALISLRASGHDYCSAVGEVFDNSIQANANNIRLKLFKDKRVVGANSKRTEVVDRVAIGDDGDGMDANVLHHALQLGYSSRYDDRTAGLFGGNGWRHRVARGESRSGHASPKSGPLALHLHRPRQDQERRDAFYSGARSGRSAGRLQGPRRRSGDAGPVVECRSAGDTRGARQRVYSSAPS